MFTPDRQKLFEDTETNEQCYKISCHSLRQHKGGPICNAIMHGECPRVNGMAQEVNQFIADNDDVFMYITTVGEK